MGASVQPNTPDDAEFQAWKRTHGNIDLRQPSDTTSVVHSTPDDAEFQQWKATQGSTSATPSTEGNLGDSLASGLTFGLSPKIGALENAAVDLVKNRSFAHAGEAYSQALERNRERLANVRQQHPALSAAVEAAGTVVPTAATTLLGGNPAIRGALGFSRTEAAPVANLATRIGQTARIGAGSGAVIAGANSEGTLPERLRETAVGGVTGGLLGAGGQVIGEAGTLLNRGIRSAFTPVATKAAQAADRQLATGFANDGGIEVAAQRGMADQNIGAPSLVAHTGGPNVNSLAWKAVSTPSKGGARLARNLVPIKEQEGAVLSRGLGEASGVGDRSAFEAASKVKNQQQLSAHTLYEDAYAEPPVHDPEITQAIVAQPRLLSAAEKALDIMEREGTATDGDRKAVQAMQFLKSNPNAPANLLAQPMSVRLLDTMKRGADDLIQSGITKDATFTKMDAKNLRSSVSNILSRVDEHVPKYAQARLVFKNDADRLSAIEQGQGVLSQSPEEITATRNNIAPQNQPDFTTGGVDAFRQKIGKKVPGSALTQTVFGSPRARGQLQAVIGDEGASAFAPYTDYGRRVEATHQRVFGGSSTAGNLKVDQPDQGMTPLGMAQFIRHPLASTGQAISRLAPREKSAFQTALADALGERLAAPNGTETAEELYNRLRELRDENNADAVGQAAARALRLRLATGITSGALAGKP